MKLNHKAIQKAITEISLLKTKFADLETMFIAYRLGVALNKIGFDYAELCIAEKEGKNG